MASLLSMMIMNLVQSTSSPPSDIFRRVCRKYSATFGLTDSEFHSEKRCVPAILSRQTPSIESKTQCTVLKWESVLCRWREPPSRKDSSDRFPSFCCFSVVCYPFVFRHTSNAFKPFNCPLVVLGVKIASHPMSVKLLGYNCGCA